MLAHIYYGIGFLIFLVELTIFLNLKRYLKFMDDIIVMGKKIKTAGKFTKDLVSKYESNIPWVSIYFLYNSFSMFWIFLGLLTDNWFLFLFYLIISLTAGAIFKNINFNYSNAILTGTSISNILFIGYMVFSHFH